MLGTFLEGSGDVHVIRRASMLKHGSLPAPKLPTLTAHAASFLTDGRPIAEAALRAHGLALIQLDEPLPTEQFIAFAAWLGPLVPERDPAVLPNVENGVLLHLRTSFGPTEDVARQPFAANFLTLHTESSGHHVAAQPRYIALMCIEPGEAIHAPQTVVAPMAAVVDRLSPETIEVLCRTRYDNERGSPAILRREEGRWVVCFRDFYRHSLAWAHDGDCPAERVNAALLELLAAMYDSQRAFSITWRRGMLVIIDNQVHLHGRSEGSFVPGQTQRHLIRLRIHSPNALPARKEPLSQGQWTPGVPPLFGEPVSTRPATLAPELIASACQVEPAEYGQAEPFMDERVLDVFARAEDPTDPFELRDLWLGRVEAELGAHCLRPELAARWRSARVHRSISAAEVLGSRATVRLVKELFNTYFRDDLYGALRSERNLILSSGSVDEETYGLPSALKETIRFALARDWYGYSDSRGREAARVAVACYESARMVSGSYSAENVVITMGATHAIASLADFVLHGRQHAAPALCAIPNYPPLVEAVARRHPLHLVPTPSRDGATSLAALRSAITPQTPLVLLQTAANPSGALVEEDELERFIEATSPSTTILLDECHEWLGAPRRFSRARARRNVVRISSLSKEWSAPGLKAGWFLADPAFVVEYYEHASTSYGGPPSLLFTFIEVLARLERWRIEGHGELNAAQVREFDGSYGLTLEALAGAYQSYLRDRNTREEALMMLRRAAVAGLRRASMRVVPSRTSINLLAILPGHNDSYRCFRETLRGTEVSVYPGVLGFHLAGGSCRITFARKWPQLSEALDRLEQYYNSPLMRPGHSGRNARVLEA